MITKSATPPSLPSPMIQMVSSVSEEPLFIPVSPKLALENNAIRVILSQDTHFISRRMFHVRNSRSSQGSSQGDAKRSCWPGRLLLRYDWQYGGRHRSSPS